MRFSIRDVLWLTVVVALAVGWGLSLHRAELRARQEAERAVYQANMARAEAMRAAEMARAAEVVNATP